MIGNRFFLPLWPVFFFLLRPVSDRASLLWPVSDRATGRHLSQQERGVGFGDLTVIVAPEDACGVGKGAQHHAVPFGQHLVVPGRLDPLLALGKQLGPAARQRGSQVVRRYAQLAGDFLQVVIDMQDVLALEVAARLDIIICRHQPRIVCTQ